MPWYTVLFIIIGAIFSLLALLLITKVSLVIKYRDDFVVYLKISFIKIRLNKTRVKKQKIKSLKKELTTKEQKKVSAQPLSQDYVTCDVIKNQAKEKVQEPEKEQVSQPNTLKTRLDKIKQKIKSLSGSHKKNTDKLIYIYELIKVFLPDFSKYLRVRIRHLEITASCQDAKDTALEYALFHTTLCQIFALTDTIRLFKINSKKTYLYCDYSGQGRKFAANVSLSLYVWQMLICTLKPLFRHMQLQGKEEQKNG